MNDHRPFRLLVVYEFAGRREHMMHALLEEMVVLMPGLRVKQLGGAFLAYRQGGFHPERLINLFWVYLKTAAYLSICRPDAVIVHTSPPGIQLWTALWAGWGKVPVYCWLMDYHPEIEARTFEKRGLGWVARILRWIDARLLTTFSGIVTLDPAMSALVRERAPESDILEHPTWAIDAPPRAKAAKSRVSADGPLRLAYTGNLGLTHDLEPLARLLEAVQKRRSAAFLVVGCSPSGEERFRRLAGRLEASVETRPRVAAFSDLGRLYDECQVDAGIVVLSADSAGLVAPSNFFGYITFGLPVVYVGPPGTNTSVVCRDFGGGFWLPPKATAEETERVASALLDPKHLADASRGALAAAEHFGRYNARTLAAALAERLQYAQGGGET